MPRTVAVLVLALIPSIANAQDAVLKGLVPEGMSTVFVTDDRGVETRGRLVTFADDAVVLVLEVLGEPTDAVCIRPGQAGSNAPKGHTVPSSLRAARSIGSTILPWVKRRLMMSKNWV